MGSISASYSYRPSYHYLTKPLSHSLPSALYLSSKPNSPTLSLSYPTGSGFNSIKLNYPKLHLGPPPPLSHNGNNNNGNNNNNDNNPGDGYDGYDGYSRFSWLLFLVCSVICCVSQFYLASCALAKVNGSDGDLWEVRGGNWVRVVEDIVKDEFVVVGVDGGEVLRDGLSGLAVRCRDVLSRLLLPEGFPESVTSDYWDYSVWRGVQGVASQVSGVLATQALLYAVGLGKGAIPTAAAINWVLKDGIGYLSKILLSKYGRHFDVHPKGWRLFADFLENAAFGLEIITPAFPNLFVLIGAVAGAGRSAAALIQAATRSCFYAGFAAQRNFAEVIAKGEAQGMVSKSIGIMLGIALANRIRSSTSLALAAFVLVTWVHMFCNLKSYQCIQLRTLNPYRASLVFSEYLLSGQAPSIKEVNDEEPLFPFITFPSFRATNNAKNAELDVLSQEAKDAAAEIERRLLLGSKLSDIIHNRQDALALFELYKDERYILAEDMGRFCVVLQESASPQDMLKALFHVNYLYWIEKNAGIGAENPSNDCRLGGRLQLSLDYVQREFNIAKTDAEAVGWSTDGLIARPLPNRIQPLIKQKST